MNSNIWIYEDTNKLLGVSQTEFATEYCGKSESYIRVLKVDKREVPTEVLINVFEKIDSIKAFHPKTTARALSQLQEKIAKEILYRNTSEKHLKLREMLIRIVDSINTQRAYDAPPILIM